MIKSTALEILRRYSNYSIVTVERQDICDTIVTGNGRPVYEVANLVFLWDHKGDIAPFVGEASKENPIRDYFSIDSFADYLDTNSEPSSPWSEHGDPGGRHTGLYSLLPPDLDRVFYFLSYRVTRLVAKWTPDDEGDLKALGADQRYVGMGNWTPSRMAFDPVARSMDWDCAASAECLRQDEDMDFRLTWNVTTKVADPATGAGHIAVSWRTSQRPLADAESPVGASSNQPSKSPEPDSNPFQVWDDAVMELGMPEEPKGAFDDWFAADEMSRLSCAIGPMRHMIKHECGLSGLSGGFCTKCVVSVDSDGLVLGCKCGVSDGCSRSVTWSTCFVPKSLLMNRDLSTEELALKLLDLPSKITANLSETNGEEDDDFIDYDEPDDGAEDEYMGERCKIILSGGNAV